ncbi:MAG: acyltransferase family protein [Clostridiales bacterium]|nr:acyltransferase family protein [Clostridiales bacterium]
MKDDKFRMIQGFRGISIILIVLWHLNYIWPKSLPEIGNIGVEYFFLISGFLVIYLHINDNKLATFKLSLNYTKDHYKKTYIEYILSGIPFIIVLLKNSLSCKSFLKILCYVFCFQAWVVPDESSISINGPTWFLSALLFCYFFTPVLIIGLKKIEPIELLTGIFITSIVYELICINLVPEWQYPSSYDGGPVRAYLTYFLPIYRFTDYSIGGVLGYMFRNSNCGRDVKTNKICLLGLLLALVAALLTGYKMGFVPQKFLVCIEAIIFWNLMTSKSKMVNKIFANNIFCTVGDISSEVFIWHYLIIIIIDKILSIYLPNISLIVKWFLCLTAVWVISFLVNIGKLKAKKYLKTVNC